MISENIKNIVFDMGEVLLPVTRDRCLNGFAQLGFRDTAKYVGSCYKDGLFQELELGNVEESVFLERVLAHCDAGTKAEQIVDVWNSFIAPIPRERLDLILELRRKYRVLLLSNTNIIHWKFVCEHDYRRNGHCVDDYFEEKYLSFELHKTKPDREIFQIMIRNSGIIPGETLFIDDAAKNCEVAESLGIHAHHAATDGSWIRIFE